LIDKYDEGRLLVLDLTHLFILPLEFTSLIEGIDELLLLGARQLGELGHTPPQDLVLLGELIQRLLVHVEVHPIMDALGVERVVYIRD
jgi:hypothetical protein